jgi:hypothetical protein
MPSAFASLWKLLLLCCCVVIVGRINAASVAQEKQTQEQFSAEVRKSFDHQDYAKLDEVAFAARESKERFPGADWKLTVFYQTLLYPNSGAISSDGEWKAHLDRLQQWRKTAPDSMTARVAIANSWVEYAKKARNTEHDWSQIEKKKIGGKEYQERLTQAKKALDFEPGKLMAGFLAKIKREYTPKPSSDLPSYCPHWYVVKLALEQGEQWEWNRYNNIFAAGVALEPTYYPLYQAKAVDLLPHNHGVKGQWEGFAENSMKTLGGAEGDITYYMIVAHVRQKYIKPDGHSDFYRDNNLWGQKAWDGFKQIEAKYGLSKYRLNEMALIASEAKQYAAARVLFDRIGEDWDKTVWPNKAAFDGYRNLAIAKTAAATPPVRSQNDANAAVGLKVTLSSRLASYRKSQEVVIEAAVENPGGQPETASAYELNIPALALAILGTKRNAQEVTLLPQAADQTQEIDKIIKPGATVRLSYRLNFALPAGDYRFKMKSLPSNELLIQIGAPGRRL